MGQRLFPVSLALAAFLGFAGVAQAQVNPPGAWKTVSYNVPSTGGPAYMYFGAWATDGTNAYYWGSSTSSASAYNELNIYSPVTDSWTVDSTTLPFPVSNGTGAYYGGYLYSFGTSQSSTNFSTVIRRPVSGGAWTTVTTTANRHHYRAAAVTVGSYIYLAGGYNSATGYMNYTTRFDPSDNSFTNLSNTPVSGLNGPSLAYSQLTGNLYMNYLTGNHEYNIATDQWTTKTQLAPVSRQYHCAATAPNNRIYVIGGSSGGIRCDEYDPLQDQWTQRANANLTFGQGPGFVNISGKLYAIGGNSNPTACQEFTPPTFGLAPNAAANVQQIGSLGVTPEAGTDPDAGWTNDTISFRADITDPDAGQQVMFIVQVKAAGSAWAAATQIQSPLSNQGTITINHTIPAGGDYHWRYRAADAFGNVTPSTGGIPGWTEFGATGTPTHVDFRSDQVDPTIPVMVYPIDQDVLVPSLVSGDVTFVWAAATDNGPLPALRYYVEIAHNDPSFGTLAASGGGIVPTQATFNLAVSRYNYYWRVGSTDIGGNFSGLPLNGSAFRVVGDDGLDHGSGDGSKVLGCSAVAGAGTGAAAALAAGLALLGAFARRRR